MHVLQQAAQAQAKRLLRVLLVRFSALSTDSTGPGRRLLSSLAMHPSVHSMTEPAVEIRPGVLRPDWSVVTKPAARQALAGRLAARAGLLDRWSCRLEANQDVLWRTVLRLFADLGRAPSITDLAATVGMAVDKVAALLSDLESRDLIG